jgi:hypothetical protein
VTVDEAEPCHVVQDAAGVAVSDVEPLRDVRQRQGPIDEDVDDLLTQPKRRSGASGLCQQRTVTERNAERRVSELTRKHHLVDEPADIVRGNAADVREVGGRGGSAFPQRGEVG